MSLLLNVTTFQSFSDMCYNICYMYSVSVVSTGSSICLQLEMLLVVTYLKTATMLLKFIMEFLFVPNTKRGLMYKWVLLPYWLIVYFFKRECSVIFAITAIHRVRQ